MAYASERAVSIEAWLNRLGLICFLAIVILGATGYLGDRTRIVTHAAAIYLFLLLVFRVAGRRTLAQTTSFDLVLILIIGDATQQALLGEDSTIASAALAILCLVSMDMTMSHLKSRFPVLDRLIEGDPVLLVEHGVIKDRPMRANCLDRDDLLSASRIERGVTDMQEIEQATLEKDGHISIVCRGQGTS